MRRRNYGCRWTGGPGMVTYSTGGRRNKRISIGAHFSPHRRTMSYAPGHGRVEDPSTLGQKPVTVHHNPPPHRFTPRPSARRLGPLCHCLAELRCALIPTVPGDSFGPTVIVRQRGEGQIDVQGHKLTQIIAFWRGTEGKVWQ